MSEEKKPKTQRINRKNRKDKIEVDHSRFMPPDAELPDLSHLDIPDADDEALESLQRMNQYNAGVRCINLCIMFFKR